MSEFTKEQRDILIKTAEYMANRENTSDYSENIRKVAEIALVMLQSFGNSEQLEPVSEPYKLPLNSFTDDELEAMAHGNNPQANAYRELLARRNSPVTTDSWIPVSERMPDPQSELRVCVYTPTEHKDIRYRFIAADLFKAVCGDATHWRYMTAPAAPKEVG